MFKFEIGKTYSCCGVHGGEYIITVTSRTEKTISFVYSEHTSDDRSVQTAEIIMQNSNVYDHKLNAIDTVEVETAVAWDYQPREYNGELLGKIEHGYYFAAPITKELWTVKEWEKFKREKENKEIEEMKKLLEQKRAELTVKELKALADKIGLVLPKKVTKAQLAKLVNDELNNRVCGEEVVEEVKTEEVKEMVNYKKMKKEDLKIKAAARGIHTTSAMSKVDLIALLEKADAADAEFVENGKEVDAEVKTLTVRAFTGMFVGEFEVVKATKTKITVTTKNGDKLIFDRKTGLQTNANNPRFANRVEL